MHLRTTAPHPTPSPAGRAARPRTVRTALAGLTAVALVAVGLVASPAPAAEAASRVTISSGVSARTVDRGTKVTVRGTYKNGTRPVTNASLRLQARTTGGWRTVKTVRPTSKGVVRTTITVNQTTQYRWVTTSGKTRSKVRKVTVRASMHASRSASRITEGDAVTIRGSYRKNGRLVPSAKVRLQQLDGTVWRQVTTGRVTKGKSSFTVRPTTTTTYRVVSWNRKVVSPARKVTVTARTSPAPTPAPAEDAFTITGSGFGHGVGMSQFGAYQMAREGASVATILGHYYSGAEVVTRTTPVDVVVQVFGPEPYGFTGYADTASSTTFSIQAGTWALRDGKTVLARAGAGDTVRLSVASGKVRARVDGAKYSAKDFRGDALTLSWTGGAVASLTRANGTYNTGTLTASVVRGKLNVNLTTTLTQYLYGIAEMPSSWGENGGAAALQAQAIAARNYAIMRISDGAKSACGGCHLVDDVRDQNYTGWKKAGESRSAGDGHYGALWQAAVNATRTSKKRSDVMLVGGKVVQAYYFSSTGGSTANSEDVWVAAIPYLRAVDDAGSLTAPGNSMRSWSRTLTQARARSIFGLPDVERIEVTARWSSGQVRSLRATSSSGQRSVVSDKADKLRSLLGLPAAWVTRVAPAA